MKIRIKYIAFNLIMLLLIEISVVFIPGGLIEAADDIKFDRSGSIKFTTTSTTEAVCHSERSHAPSTSHAAARYRDVQIPSLW